MKKSKYTYKRLADVDGSNTQAWELKSTKPSQHSPDYYPVVQVWFYPDSKSARCCHCSTALHGMSSSCVHARFLLRRLVAPAAKAKRAIANVQLETKHRRRIQHRYPWIDQYQHALKLPELADKAVSFWTLQADPPEPSGHPPAAGTRKVLASLTDLILAATTLRREIAAAYGVKEQNGEKL